MRLVVIESPFGTNPDGSRADPETVERNLVYARRAMLWCLRRAWPPYGSHLLYPQCLNDATPEERELGIQSGFEWGKMADAVLVFTDYGITPGMLRGIDRAREAGQLVEHVKIGRNDEEHFA